MWFVIEKIKYTEFKAIYIEYSLSSSVCNFEDVYSHWFVHHGYQTLFNYLRNVHGNFSTFKQNIMKSKWIIDDHYRLTYDWHQAGTYQNRLHVPNSSGFITVRTPSHTIFIPFHFLFTQKKMKTTLILLTKIFTHYVYRFCLQNSAYVITDFLFKINYNFFLHFFVTNCWITSLTFNSKSFLFSVKSKLKLPTFSWLNIECK